MDKIPTILSQSIDVLAQKFGSTGLHLYTALIQGTFVSSIINSAIGLVLALIGFVLFSMGGYQTFKRDKYADFSGFIIFGTIFAIMGLLVFSNDLVGIFAPEYKLIIDLIHTN